MKKISYRAPGKIIISGEHAVVFGKPALTASIDRYLTFSIWETDKVMKKDGFIGEIEKRVAIFLKDRKIDKKNKSFNYSIDSTIPVGRGMGSSAALAVASSASFLEFFTGRSFPKEEVNKLAYEIEKYFHGKPSGVDNSTSCFGGLIYYRKEFEFLKNITSLSIKIPQLFVDRLLLIDSGKPDETTREMVAGVSSLYNRSLNKTNQLLQKIETVTKKIVLSIYQENSDLFREEISNNEKILESLGVVSKSTIKLLKNLAPFGVGKIIGAGGKKKGSGFILFYSEKQDILRLELEKIKMPYLLFTPQQKGLEKVE